jgi:hypothetical protein
MNAEELTGYVLLIAVFLILAVVMVASFVQ